MILEVLLALLAIGTLASAAMALKVAPVYSAMMSMAVWLVVAYASTSVDVLLATNDEVVTHTVNEPALAILAFGNAAISLIILVAAVAGQYGAGEQTGIDEPYNPTEHP
ncbi:hypothetical protein OB905_13160 [Halobacteria archaeon AArc-dxtr1]|nr:hypothetical protein [Halobacteria archaeon AArc-dxtr1]